MSDAITKLGLLLQEAGVRVYFDLGNSIRNPCMFCAAPSEPGAAHELVVLGTYFQGDPISRPVCERCKPIAEARRTKPPRLTPLTYHYTMRDAEWW